MANLLYLVHRLPYPPNKGDKVRSYHLLRHLLQQHRVFLGTFVDDPEDEQHIATLSRICPDLHVERLAPRTAKLMSATGLLRGEALTLAYYRSAGMQRWVAQVAREHALDASVVSGSVASRSGETNSETWNSASSAQEWGRATTVNCSRIVTPQRRRGSTRSIGAR